MPKPPSPAAPPSPRFRIEWTVPLKGSLTAPPAFSGARGFFPLDENRLTAKNLADGADAWSVSGSSLFQPATGEGLVFFVEPTRIRAVRQEDGSEAWQQPFFESIAVPLVWDNGWLIAATTSGGILAFRAGDGHLIWRRDLDAKAAAQPALAADRVYVPAGSDRIVALQVEDGTIVWERRLGGMPNDILALDDRVYVGSTDNYFYCLKSDDGVVDWRWPTGADVIGVPVVDERSVYFVSLDNVLRALNRTSGNQRWKRALPLRPNRGARRAGDMLVVSGLAPVLRAYSVKDGAPAGEISADGDLATAPYVFPETESPTLIVVARNIEKGTTLSSIIFSSVPAPAPATDLKPPPAPKP